MFAHLPEGEYINQLLSEGRQKSEICIFAALPGRMHTRWAPLKVCSTAEAKLFTENKQTIIHSCGVHGSSSGIYGNLDAISVEVKEYASEGLFLNV